MNDDLVYTILAALLWAAIVFAGVQVVAATLGGVS